MHILYRLLSDVNVFLVLQPIELWTGKQLFSVLLRPHANMRVYVNLTVREKNYSKSGETMCPNDGFVYFRNSELICGQLGKATLGQLPLKSLFICMAHRCLLLFWLLPEKSCSFSSEISVYL